MRLGSKAEYLPFLQTHAELKAEAVDYVTGLEDDRVQEPPLPIVALLVDASPEAADLEALKASVLQARHHAHCFT